MESDRAAPRHPAARRPGARRYRVVHRSGVLPDQRLAPQTRGAQADAGNADFKRTLRAGTE